MIASKLRRRAGLLAGSILLLAADLAFGQGASQITPPTFRPPIESTPRGGVIIPAATGLQTPAGAEKLLVRLRGLRVDGAFPELADETRAIEARIATGKDISAADIFAAARELEETYARAGYVLVRVVLPPQELNGGSILHLIVVDGVIDAIETKNLPSAVRSRIDAVVAPLIGRPKLKVHEIERRLLLAGDAPGVILRSSLAPGEKPGTTVLALEAHYQPVSGLLMYDNTLSPALGTHTVGIGLEANSVFGLGELFYVRAIGNPNGGDNGFFSANPRNRSLAAGVVVPVGYDGFTVNLEATQSHTAPVPTIQALQPLDHFERWSLRARYPWLRGRQLNFATEATLDIINSRQTLLFNGTPVPLSEDRLRVLRLNADGSYLSPWDGVISGRATLSFGLDALNARNKTEADASGIPLSRQGSDAAFSKIDATVAYSQALFGQFEASLQARAQYAFGRSLPRAEQFGIASQHGLSAFEAGTLQGDSGYVIRAELGHPLVLPTIIDDLGLVAAPYVFGAVGQVYLHDPTALEAPSIAAASYGVGLRINSGMRGRLASGSLGLEYGFQHRSDNEPTNGRFTVNFLQRF